MLTLETECEWWRERDGWSNDGRAAAATLKMEDEEFPLVDHSGRCLLTSV